MARAAGRTGAKAMGQAAGTSLETSRGRAAGIFSIRSRGSAAGGAASGSSRCSFAATDHPADQIVAIERSQVDPIALADRLERRNDGGEPPLFIAAEFLCRLDRDGEKAKRVARPAA